MKKISVEVVNPEPQIDFIHLNRTEYNGQLVLTTEQLAAFYETKPTNITANFFHNKDHFVEGKHYFKIEGAELEAFKNSVKNFNVVGKRASSLYLWTKRGAARHCKSVGTDSAWNVYELLEDCYFDTLEKTVTADKSVKEISDFRRGRELVKLARSATDPATKKRLIAKAANLILGEEFLDVPEKAPKISAQILLEF